MEIAKTLAVVTGGAQGAGFATVQSLVDKGATVAVFDVNDQNTQALDDMECLFFKVDVSDEKAVDDAFTKLTEQCSLPLRTLVNCAGIAPASRMMGKSGPKPLDKFESVLKVNLIGTYNTMRVASYLMSQQDAEKENRGVIINTASVAAFEGQIGQTAYASSKAGVVGMTLPAARELAQFGIRVMTIAPGLLDTPMLQTLPSDVRQALADNIPFPKRFAAPDEFANLVQSIIENDMLNGEVIRLDGGLRMQPI